MRARRRIFRRGGTMISVGLLAGAGFAALLVLGLGTAGLPALLPGLGAVSAPTAPGPRATERLQLDPREVAVVDGETLRLRDQVVRLAGIDAPSRGEACPASADCGGAAASALASLVRDRRLDCRLDGQDALGRPFAACDASGTDLSSAIVASGWARARDDSPVLARLEAKARQKAAGLWAETARN